MKGKIFKVIVGITMAGIAGGGVYLFLRWRRNKNPKVDVALETEYFFDRKEADQMLKEELEKGAKERGVDIQEEINRVFQEKYNGGIVRDDDDPGESEMDISREKMARGVRGYGQQTEEERKNFEEYMAAMESPDEDEDDIPEDEFDDDDDREIDGPYPITAAQFCNTRSYYDKVSLSYYTDDDVVSDEKDKVMDNAEEVLGQVQDVIKELDHPSICYIRNEELEIDYEISVIDGSYRREVLHLEED